MFLKTKRIVSVLLTVAMLLTGTNIPIIAESITNGENTEQTQTEPEALVQTIAEDFEIESDSLMQAVSETLVAETEALLPGVAEDVETEASLQSVAEDFTWNLADDGTLTISGNGDMPNIPSSIVDNWRTKMTKAVIEEGITSISDVAFFCCENLTEITIPDSVTTIGSGAFLQCTGLTEINIPDSVESIGSRAFYGCTGLAEITIPSGVTSMEQLTFKDCTGLTRVTLADGITDIGKSVFEGCTSLAAINIPDSVKSIGEYAFIGCKSLTEITVPDSVTSMGRYVFKDCIGLTKVTLGDGLALIAEKMFYECTGLTEINIPASVTSIGEGAFSYSGLTEINIPDSVKSIGSDAFSPCTGLTEINIPDSVESIGERAFYGCTGLAEITIPSGVTRMERLTFEYCTGLTRVTLPDGITAIGERVFEGCTSLAAINIPDSVKSIGSAAFAQCTGLTEINIPDSVTSIGEGAFSSSGLKGSITIPNGFTSVDAWFSSCPGITEIIIPDGVTSIGGNAFGGCMGLTEITIPDSVKSIGEYAFSGCKSLTEITIPASVTSIGEGAFSYSGLTGSITIPDGFTSIDGWFHGCSGLTEITIPSGIKTIGKNSFYGCAGLTEINIPDSVTTIGIDAFARCTGLTEINIPDSVKSIGEAAFIGCKSLTEITVPDSVTSMGRYIFKDCIGLTKVTLADGLALIAASMFYQCIGLTEINIPASVTSIGEGAFSYSGLTEINIPDSVESIGERAFYYSGLTEINIPDSVESIGERAFYGCTGLTYVNLPNYITSIEESTFEGCTGLTEITIPDNVTQIGAFAFRGSGLTEIVIPESVKSINSSAFSRADALTIICYPETYAETYAIKYDIPYIYIGAEAANSLELEITDSRGVTVDGDLTISWYEKGSDTVIATGKKLIGYDKNKEYQLEVVLGETLSYVYYQPQRQDAVVADSSTKVKVTLEKIKEVAAAGCVVDAENMPIANANITFNQTFNGKYTKPVNVVTDENGNYSASIPNVPTKAVVSKTGYYSGNIFVIANRLAGDSCALDTVTLQKLPENKITLSISKTAVQKGDESPLRTTIPSAVGIEIKVKSITSGREITNFEVQYPNLIIGDLSVNGGDVVEITATDSKGLMTAAPVRVTLDAQKMGNCNIEFVENGYIKGTGIVGNPENYVFVFDGSGDYVNTYIAKGSFTSDSLVSGEYTLVFIKKTSLLRSVKNLGKLPALGLAENTDYIVKRAAVEAGRVTVLDGVTVPVLDESKLYYTVKEKTRFASGSATAVVGRYIIMRAEYKVDDQYYTAGGTVSIELPKTINVNNSSLTLNGKPCVYSVENNTLSVQTNTQEGIIRFYVVATEDGKYDVNAYLSFDSAGTEIMQPIGTASVSIENAKINVPKKTAVKRTTVRGLTIPGGLVTIYDNDVCVGTTTANKVGSWSHTFDLISPELCPYQYIYATIATPNNSLTFNTDEELLVYDETSVQLSKITMINQAHTSASFDLVEYVTEFDFIQPKPVEPYWYWPAYPDFTFKLKFNGDSSVFRDVYVVTKTFSGEEIYVPMAYDSDADLWLGTHSYDDSDTIPTTVGARWETGGSLIELDPCAVPQNDFFAEVIGGLKEMEETKELIEEEAKKENPDFSQFDEEDDELTPEEKAELEEKYSQMSQQELKMELEELTAQSEEYISSLEETVAEFDAYSTDYTTTAISEVTGDMIDYTIKGCDGIQESELEAQGYTKYTDVGGGSYYIKSVENFYSYVNFAEDVYMEIDLESAMQLMTAELNSNGGSSTAYWRNTAEGVLNAIDVVKSFLDAFEKMLEDSLAKALAEFAKLRELEKESKLLIQMYQSNPDNWFADDIKAEQKKWLEIEKKQIELSKKVNLIRSNYNQFLKTLKISPIFQYITLMENVALNLIKYCNLYDSITPCEDDEINAESVRFAIAASAASMVVICVSSTVAFAAMTNPVTIWGGLLAIAAEYAVAQASSKLFEYNLKQLKRDANELKCNKDDDDDNGDDGDDGDDGYYDYDDDDDDDDDDQDSPYVLDPSGYVYEAVPSNRIEGVKAECYYYDFPIDEFGMPGESKEEIFWTAEEYNQVNPLITDKNGMYAWDVPIGEWLVKFSKEGYYDTDSKNDPAVNANGYLPVPPPQTEVNTAIVSKAAPIVETVNVYNNEIQIIFSQYMQIDTVNTTNVKVTSGGAAVSGTISPVNAEYDYDEVNMYASIFKFTPDAALTGSADVEISNVKNYAGTTIAAKAVQSQAVAVKPEGITISSNVSVPYNSGALVEITISPKEAGANKTLTISTSSPSIIGVVNNTVTTDENGKAVVMLNGNLPGEGEIKISLDGTDMETSTRATVGNVADTSNSCAKVTASIESRSTVAKGTKLTLSTATEGAEIYYTLDGTCPCVVDSASRLKYTEPLTINEDMFIIAYAVKDGFEDSATAGFIYTVAETEAPQKVDAPVASPKGGSVASGTTVTLSTTTANATIHYTTDGTTPTEQSPVYTSAITVTSAMTIKAIAVKDGMTASDVMSESYTITASGGTGSGGGGGVSRPSSSGGSSFAPSQTQTVKKFKFTDVKETDWYYEAVKFAYEKGITSGVSETSFAPADSVTRGQFITMLCRAYGISEKTGDNFSDCGNTWYTGYLAAAKQLGISSGIGDNKFAPENKITREEMVTLIYNYLKSKGEIREESTQTAFADNDSISDWAKAAVSFASGMGYVNGKENNVFDPQGNATRAELAKIFFNIFANSDR